jgi:hypothetical protein
MYCIHCMDDPDAARVDTHEGRFGGSEDRMRVYQEHKEYQNRTSDPCDPAFIRKVKLTAFTLLHNRFPSPAKAKLFRGDSKAILH